MATLTARLRSERGKNAARAMRREGRVPAVMYGHGDETREISVNTHELEKLLSSISVENTLIDVQVEGAESTRALIREVQYHPWKPVVLHVDFYQIHAGEKIHLEIPVRLNGTPLGVRESGGVLQQVIHDLSVECLPRDIPESVDIEVTDLDIGESIYVKDIQIPNATILRDGELPICSVTAPTVAALPEEAEEGEGVEAVEPELIRERGEDAEDVPTSEQGGTD